MKRNILRAAVAASILGISGVAFAASDDVHFSGTILENCSISAVVDGTIALVDIPAADGTTMSSDSGVASAGTIGSFDVTCLTGTAAITIHAPVGSDPTTTTFEGAAGYVADARLYSDVGITMIASEDTAGAGTVTAAAQPAASGVTYYVNMDASTTGDIASGTYNYDVTVDVTSG